MQQQNIPISSLVDMYEHGELRIIAADPATLAAELDIDTARVPRGEL